jgi:hypothetical protein
MAPPFFDPAAAPDAALLALGLALKQARYRHVTVTPATHQRVLRRPPARAASSLTDVLGWSRRFRPPAPRPRASAMRWRSPPRPRRSRCRNDDALRLTALNAALANAAGVTPLNSNLLAGADGQFDLIVANPPYCWTRANGPTGMAAASGGPACRRASSMAHWRAWRRAAGCCCTPG